MTTLAALSIISLILTLVIRLLAMAALTGLICGCIKSEDKRRKFAFMALVFNDFRTQAININYMKYQKRKLELLNGFLKCVCEDIP